jgi:glycosyltransferase involved in cell wall biosynthesis
MLSVIIPTWNSQAHLEALLPVLVPAAVDGFVREVIASDAGSTDATALLCEEAGVDVLTRGLAAAGKAAKGDRLLILPPDLQLEPGWETGLKRHLNRGGAPGLLLESRAKRFPWSLLKPKRVGLLVTKEVFMRLKPKDIDSLRRLLPNPVRIA